MVATNRPDLVLDGKCHLVMKLAVARSPPVLRLARRDLADGAFAPGGPDPCHLQSLKKRCLRSLRWR